MVFKSTPETGYLIAGAIGWDNKNP